MVRVNWTFQAVSDLKQISDYISNDSKRYAKHQVLKIKNATKVLKKHPLIGKMVLEINDENIREIIIGKYRIIYKIISKKKSMFLLFIIHLEIY